MAWPVAFFTSVSSVSLIRRFVARGEALPGVGPTLGALAGFVVMMVLDVSFR